MPYIVTTGEGGYDSGNSMCTCASPDEVPIICAEQTCQDIRFVDCALQCTGPSSCQRSDFAGTSSVSCDGDFSCAFSSFLDTTTVLCGGNNACYIASLSGSSSATCELDSCRFLSVCSSSGDPECTSEVTCIDDACIDATLYAKAKATCDIGSNGCSTLETLSATSCCEGASCPSFINKCGAPPVEPPPVPTCPGPETLLANPRFDRLLFSWQTFVKDTDTSLVGSITDGGNGALFDIETSGEEDWHMQIYQQVRVPVSGQFYTLTFVMVAEAGEGGAGQAYIQQQGGSWDVFGRTECSVGEPGGFGSTTVCIVEATIDDVSLPIKFGFEHDNARGGDGGRFTLTGAALCVEPPRDPLRCPAGSTNLLPNPRFLQGLESWRTYVKAYDTSLEGSITAFVDPPRTGWAVYDVQTAAEKAWHMQLYQVLVIPEAGQVYTLSFTILPVGGRRSNDKREVEVYIQQDEKPYALLAKKACVVGSGDSVTCTVSAVVEDILLPIAFGVKGATEEGVFRVTSASVRSCSVEAAQSGGR